MHPQTVETPREARDRLDRHPLTAHAGKLGEIRRGVGLVVYLSRLSRENLTRNRLRLASNAFDLLIEKFSGERFQLATGDLVLTFRNCEAGDVLPAVSRVRNLFGNDPLFRDAGAGDEARLHAIFALPLEKRSYALLVSQLARHPLLDPAPEAEEPERARAGGTEGTGPHAPAPRRAATASDPAHSPGCDLARALDLLALADTRSFLRRQTIALLDSEARLVRPVFSELYTSIADLRRHLSPAGDITANRWVFQAFTQALDVQVLEFLVRSRPPGLRRRFSLNLNVATLLSPSFDRFVRELPGPESPGIMIELQLADICQDVGGFLFARDSLQEKGFRFCVDGLTPLVLPWLDPFRLGVDFAKILIPADMVSLEGEEAEHLREAARNFGRRIILCRCPDGELARAGAALGIRMFQGAYVDGLIRQQADASPAET